MARLWHLQREGWAEENPRHLLLLACHPSLMLLAKSSRWGINDRLSWRSHLASTCVVLASPQLLQQCTNEQVGWNSAFCREHEGFCAADTCKCSSSYHSPKQSQLGLCYCRRVWVVPWVCISPSWELYQLGWGQAEMQSVHSLKYWDFSLGHLSSERAHGWRLLSVVWKWVTGERRGGQVCRQQSPSAELASNPGPVFASQVLDEALKICNYIFTVIFVLESVFKLIAFGFRRFFQDR